MIRHYQNEFKTTTNIVSISSVSKRLTGSVYTFSAGLCSSEREMTTLTENLIRLWCIGRFMRMSVSSTESSTLMSFLNG